MKQDALAYAKNGWAVIPIWWMGEDGVCGCGNPFCGAAGKHPLVVMGRGMANASTDRAQVEDWWDRWPNANIAIACGERSGLVVVDCDIRDDHDGYVEFMQWCGERGIDVPHTLVAETGSGGRHLLFRYDPTALKIKNATGWLEDVDLKSDGGYIVVAPSMHSSGRVYRWLSAQGTQPAPLGPELANALATARTTVRAGAGGVTGDQPVYDYREAVKVGPRKGHRDHFFNSRAFELRKADVSMDDALTDLQRLHAQSEQSDDDPFPWEAVLAKVKRVYEDVEPDEAVEWDPFASAGEVAVGRGANVGLDPNENSFTDRGNAWQMIRRFGDQLRWCPAYGWMIWDEQRWVRDSLEKVMEFAGRTVDDMGRTAYLTLGGDERDDVLAWVHKSRSARAIQAIVTTAKSFPDLKIDIDEFDSNPWMLNVANGTINLQTGELHEHRREDYITKMSHVRYEPEAADARWGQYLFSTTSGDVELMEYIQQATGYSLTGLTREDALFMLYGPTASGKSTFISAIETCLGEYAMTIQPEVLMKTRQGGAPASELARMRGCRLVTTVEPNEGDRFAEGLVKQMTGGDKIAARHLYKDGFEFTPEFKLWVATNSKPQASDPAFFRRMKVVPFPNTIPLEERDLKLKDEWLRIPQSPGAEAVLAWAVHGAVQWYQADRLHEPDIVKMEVEEYREDFDTLGDFISDCLELMPGVHTADAMVEMKDVYKIYQLWAEEHGEEHLKQQALTMRLKNRAKEIGIVVKRRGRITYVIGAKIREEAQIPTWTGGQV